MCHANEIINLMEENVIPINGGITINVDVSVKNITHVKKIKFVILPHVVVRMEDISWKVLLTTQQLLIMKL